MGEMQGYVGTTYIDIGAYTIEIDWSDVEGDGVSLSFNEGNIDGVGSINGVGGQYGVMTDVYTEWWQDESIYLGTEYSDTYFKPLALQGGHYNINQVLSEYGYASREEYLFPKPTFFERLLNFGIPLDREDLAEKVIEAVGDEWDLIHQNLDAVDLGRLELYKNDLWSLRFNLMTKVEAINSKIAGLNQYNPGGGNASEIRSLTNLRWDMEDHLIPINRENDEINRAIKYKIMK